MNSLTTWVAVALAPVIIVTVAFAALALLSVVLPANRRDYALEVLARLTELAKVVVPHWHGRPRPRFPSGDR